MPTLAPALADTFPLVCSDVSLVCSDDMDCGDNGAVAAATSTGTLASAATSTGTLVPA